MSESVLKWVKLNQLSARLMAGGPCHAVVIPLFPVSGTQEALSLWAKGEKKKKNQRQNSSSKQLAQTTARNISQSTWAQAQQHV